MTIVKRLPARFYSVANVAVPGTSSDTVPTETLFFEKHDYQDSAGRVLPYRLLRPPRIEADRRYPLVVFLHGAGERGTDNEKQLTHGARQFASVENRDNHPCFLIAPQCPEGQRWVEVDWSADRHTRPEVLDAAGRLTLELIEKSIRDLPVDPKRVYITGLSMGAFGAWDLLSRRPELFAAAVCVCGGADEATAAAIKHIPTWVFHGARDRAVNPARSRNMVLALQKAGGTPTYTEYADVGHNSWDNAYGDPELYKWLFGQTKE
jgi:predicted peptidase